MAELKVLKFDLSEDGVTQEIGEALTESFGKGFMIVNSVGAGNYAVYVLIKAGALAGGIRPIPRDPLTL